MKILSIIGARPQFIKAAAFRKFCLENGVNEILLHTGQHYDPEMSTNIFSDLDIKKPDFKINLKERSHAGMTGELLAKIESLIIKTKPDYVNVYGDTNSTLAGALAASKLHVPIIHIEAGLRSFNKNMPEEINRIITDHVSDFLFCPTFASLKNLKKENITNGVHHVGDIMYDAVKHFSKYFKFPDIKNKNLTKKLAVMTIHRADKLSDPTKLKEVISYCERFCDDYNLIFPVHPHTKNKLNEYNVNTGAIELIEPLKYLEMQGLLEKSDLVLTDSGGLQKEAYFHKCECITLRDETEWLETIDAGWNKLWKSNSPIPDKKYIDEYGKGDSASRIIEILN
jgi:UDP-GlcNAc3NAcA epimerase